MATSRSTPMLYRDLLRLVKHVAGDSPKAVELQRIIGIEFRKQANLTDETEIEMHKFNAVRALSNYLIAEEQVKQKIPLVDDDESFTGPPKVVTDIYKWESDMNKNHFKPGKNGFKKKYPRHHGPSWSTSKAKGTSL